MAHVFPKQTWIVVPGLNEAKYLPGLLRQLSKQTSNIIYVDDGSRDASVDIARKYTKHVLVHRVNLGKGAALNTGCEYAFAHRGAQYIIVMDADGQHDPAELPLFSEKLRQGYEVVLGIRSRDKTMPLLRTLGNRAASRLIQAMFGRYIPDIPCGYKAFTRAAYTRLKWAALGYEVEMEIAVRVAKAKLVFTTVNIRTIYHDLDKGMTMLDVLQMLFHTVNWRLTL